MKYKVPFRMIYCETISQWLSEIVWCFFVLKLFPDAFNFGPRTPGICPFCSAKMIGFSEPDILKG